MSRALVFIGFMGAGKSSAARAAGEAGMDAVDADDLLEHELGMSIAEFFEQKGEAAFRQREAVFHARLLERADGAAIALGGGSVLTRAVREALADHTVVWLDVDPDTAWSRVGGQPDRPLAQSREAFDALHAHRASLYAACADAVLPADRGTDLVRRALPALRTLREAPPATKLAWASSASGEYPAYVGEGLLEAGFHPVDGRRFAVTDGNVARWYLGSLEPLLGSAAIMPGEASKTVAHAEIVWTEMVRHGVTRSDHVVALGGGVVGDLAGFCAATFQRGMPVVQVPTSLVAQVDSAYGGKTGVDLSEAKNYVGAYHQPAAVIADPSTLRTLPAAELAAGYVEVLKTALIAGGELWERVRAGETDGTDAKTILACVRTKLAIVADDERDAGRRQVLNLGHTVGHAIESATGYARYRHGEAVGLGLLAALRLSDQSALHDEVAELLRARNLPTRLEEVQLEEIAAAVARDKKRLGDEPVPFVLLDAPGAPRTGCAVAQDDLHAAIRELMP
ncbi:MAG: bifunctional shikimate kinase/3-dehydroquinate synthase [Actinomycetota bacterium]|nr:bifunctional shikimate kinase/3-dehydroquinate synthase [Actinomycetota bacterium]